MFQIGLDQAIVTVRRRRTFAATVRYAELVFAGHGGGNLTPSQYMLPVLGNHRRGDDFGFNAIGGAKAALDPRREATLQPNVPVAGIARLEQIIDLASYDWRLHSGRR